LGYGDDIMGSGMARGAWARGKRVAFGDGRRIIWGPWSEEMFRHNPNVARPGSEGAADIEWINYYKGHRQYNSLANGRWVWNMQFRATPGEIYFSADEAAFAQSSIDPGFVMIEPNVPQQKSVAVNKQWPIDRYQEVADVLVSRGHHVVQPMYTGARYLLRHIHPFKCGSFRNALALLARAALYIGPEGGMHHGAAAVGTPAVVIFGGFIPPQVTGYASHVNLTGGDIVACGSLTKCEHCARALEAITVEDVVTPALRMLGQTNKVA
jgi:hypothetical protein